MLLAHLMGRARSIACLAMLAAVGCEKSDSPPPSEPVEKIEVEEPMAGPAASPDEPLVAEAGTTLYQLNVEGMHCQGCGDTIAKKLNGLPGARQVRVSFNRKMAWVLVDDGSPTSFAQIEQAVVATGYKASPASAPAAGEKGAAYDIILKNGGDRKIMVIKAVRAATGLGLKEAKDLVEGAPALVKQGVPEDEARKLREEFEQAGAEVEVKAAR